MKKILVLIIALVIFIPACEKIDTSAPGCIKDLIREYSKNPTICENSARVDEYLFQGNFVYVFDPGNCGADMSAPVYDSNCKRIGSLGGFTGNLIINNVRFDIEAKFKKTIWRD